MAVLCRLQKQPSLATESTSSVWGLTVNPNKTVFHYFSSKSIHIPVLRYDGHAIAYKSQHGMLGMTFDAPRLHWGPHISSPRSDIIKSMDPLKHMASPNWGASRCFLKLFYCS
jgi:hypothetical protein